MKISMIPTPQKIIYGEGSFSISATNLLVTLAGPYMDARLLYHTRRIFGKVKESVFYCYQVTVGNGKPTFDFLLSDGLDAYALDITPDGICLSAQSARGLFYGLITLEKMAEQFGNVFPCVCITDYAQTQERWDYWDLRSIHPPFEHLLRNLQTIARAKLNGIVIEYEDKLPIGEPFSVKNEFFSFSAEQFAQLKSECALWFLDIIPLQQSFGHLEYLLKDTRYTHLRETPLAVGDLCPCNPESAQLATQLVSQMAKKHPDSRYLHIGCDEVWSLCSCDACLAAGKRPELLLIEFANKVISAVAQMGKIPLLWHDMFEGAAQEELALLDKRAAICIWIYNANDLEQRVQRLTQMFEAAGLTYFACPAMRAWDCDDKQNYPVLEQRMNNIRLWHNAMQKANFRGILNTNWAACFALAKPYGPYETSFFPLYYSAELAWNATADSASYLDRFFADFHGWNGGAQLLQQGYRNEDYFSLLASLTVDVPRGNEIVRLIKALRAFEEPTRRFFPLSVVLYRQEFFQSSEEYDSLLAKYKSVCKRLNEAVPRLEQELEKFLPPYAVRQFIRSRLLTEQLVIKKAEEFLNIETELTVS